ncbi:hypothetical protein L665_00441 [Ralstonia solanacearum SD54]|nr:hypothetical protein L665_00441 [Ralstonia solanacearum SD54]
MRHRRQWRMQRYTEQRKPYEKAAGDGHGETGHEGSRL